jgi:hypothetical protein
MADLFDEMVEAERFLELVAVGVHPVNAGIEVGWSPAKTKAHMKEPEFADMVSGAIDRANASMEEALYQKGLSGNVSAMMLWLFNRAPDRWRDVKRIEVRSEHKVSVTAVESVKAGVLQLIREQGVGAMQALEDPGIIDGDVIE